MHVDKAWFCVLGQVLCVRRDAFGMRVSGAWVNRDRDGV